MIYLFLILKMLFHISCDTITALKKYLKIFEKKGLCGIWGENMTVAEKEINIACSCLDEIGALPEETAVDILTRLVNCSVPELTKLFDLMLQAACVDVLDLNADPNDNTLLQIKMIMTNAVDVYHALCISRKWCVNHTRLSLVVCWNYGKEGHTYQYCKKLWDQAKIDDTKKTFEKKKHGGNVHKKWGENANTIAPDTNTEGGGSNSNNVLAVSSATLPEEDSSKVVGDKTMAVIVLTKLEHNTASLYIYIYIPRAFSREREREREREWVGELESLRA